MMYDLPADLHLHTALSPCAEREMSPRGLVEGALRAGLAAIAVTDHNAAGNAGAVLAAAEEAGIWAIPGMEVQTREEVHLLCYFPDLAALRAWEEFVWRGLPDLANDERLFGRQELYGLDGTVAGECPRLLLTAIDLSVEEIFRKTAAQGGLCLPAHVDRPSFGILGQLGFLPPIFPSVRPLELSRRGAPLAVCAKFGLPGPTRFFTSSDAHCLSEIGQRPSCLRVAEASWEEFCRAVEGIDGRWLGLDPI